jgi:hypothetical protein
MRQVVHHEVVSVQSRLAELGLDEADLRDAVMQGMLARSECTPNDPPLTPGFNSWSRTVRALREKLIPKHWTRSDEGNYPLVVNPAGNLAIAVATGDDCTAIATSNPMTKSPKGPRTQSAIEVNQYQSFLFEGFPDFDVPATPHNDRVTWILLQHYDQRKKEVRFELSRPSSYAGKIDGWSERIILNGLPFDPALVIPVPMVPNLPDIDIPLIRRA